MGADYTVMVSIGHTNDLPMKELGVDVDNNFEPHNNVVSYTKTLNKRK